MITEVGPKTPVADEIAVMRRIVTALDTLDPRARHRVVDWLRDRYWPVDAADIRIDEQS